MIKNNFFDNNQLMNDNIVYGRQAFKPPNPSSPVNLDILSSGVKSDIEQEKVGSDTCSYFEYRNKSEF